MPAPEISITEMPGVKKITIVLNGVSARKKFFYTKILPVLSSLGKVDVVETQSGNHAFELTSKAVDEGAHAIIAAGGDGTLHQVVNGVLHGRENDTSLPAIGLLPLGSANDFARSVNLNRNPEGIKQLLMKFIPRPVDVGKISMLRSEKEAVHYFINIADTGMGPYVADRINKGNKFLPPGVTYYSAILKTFFTYSSKTVEIKTEDWNWSGKIRTLAIANGKCFGHGLIIAPDAQVDDGIFSVFIAEDVSVLEFIRYSGTIKKGKIVQHPKIQYRQAQKIHLSSTEKLMLEADGEVIGHLPVQIELLPKRLPFLY